MIKTMILLFAWFSAGAMAVLAVFLFIAPFLVSIITNIGRRPVVLATMTRRTPHMMRPSQRSSAY